MEPFIQDYEKPRDYDQVMDYLRAHPGISYEKAKADVAAGKGPQVCRVVPDHERIMTYLRRHPGMSYEQAEKDCFDCLDDELYGYENIKVHHEQIMHYVRANPGISYEKAKVAVQKIVLSGL